MDVLYFSNSYDNILNDEKTKVSENEYSYLKEKEVIDFFIPDITIIENYVIFESDIDKANVFKFPQTSFEISFVKNNSSPADAAGADLSTLERI